MPLLLEIMLKEEYRMHVSYSSRTIFLALPMFICFIAFGMGISLTQLERNISIQELLTLTHVGIFLYGLSVGAFGFLGKTYIERRYGKNNYLINMPALLPLSFKRTFLGMYFRDVIFYLVLVLLPALLGLLLAAPIAHFSVISIGGVFVGTLLSFLIGVSFSFAVSVVYTRSVKAFIFVAFAFIALVIGSGVFGLYSIELLLPALAFQLSLPPLTAAYGSAAFYFGICVVVIVAFTALATLSVRESINGGKSHFKNVYPRYYNRFAFARSYQTLIAKEFVDLIRSGTIGKMVFSFVAPLVFLSFSTWYVNYGLAIPVGFNTVFYAAMVGFFGVLLYSWLTNCGSLRLLRDAAGHRPKGDQVEAIDILISHRRYLYRIRPCDRDDKRGVAVALARPPRSIRHFDLHGRCDRVSHWSESQFLPVQSGDLGEVRGRLRIAGPGPHDLVLQPLFDECRRGVGDSSRARNPIDFHFALLQGH